jgi:hypothetical protein
MKIDSRRQKETGTVEEIGTVKEVSRQNEANMAYEANEQEETGIENKSNLIDEDVTVEEASMKEETNGQGEAGMVNEVSMIEEAGTVDEANGHDVVARYLLVDAATGEVVRELGAGIRIVDASVYRNSIGPLEWACDSYALNGQWYVKVTNDGLSVLLGAELSSLERKVLVLLAGKVQWGSNKAVHGNGKPVTATWLMGETGYTKQYVYKALRNLLEKRIISRIDGWIYLNPRYIYKGSHLSQDTVNIFTCDVNV